MDPTHMKRRYKRKRKRAPSPSSTASSSSSDEDFKYVRFQSSASTTLVDVAGIDETDFLLMMDKIHIPEAIDCQDSYENYLLLSLNDYNRRFNVSKPESTLVKHILDSLNVLCKLKRQRKIPQSDWFCALLDTLYNTGKQYGFTYPTLKTCIRVFFTTYYLSKQVIDQLHTEALEETKILKRQNFDDVTQIQNTYKKFSAVLHKLIKDYNILNQLAIVQQESAHHEAHTFLGLLTNIIQYTLEEVDTIIFNKKISTTLSLSQGFVSILYYPKSKCSAMLANREERIASETIDITIFANSNGDKSWAYIYDEVRLIRQLDSATKTIPISINAFSQPQSDGEIILNEQDFNNLNRGFLNESLFATTSSSPPNGSSKQKIDSRTNIMPLVALVTMCIHTLIHAERLLKLYNKNHTQDEINQYHDDVYNHNAEFVKIFNSLVPKQLHMDIITQ